MQKNKSFDMYCKFLTEQQNNFINQLNGLIRAFSTSDKHIKHAAITLNNTASRIISIIAATDKPQWLNSLNNELNLFLKFNPNVDTKDRLMQSIIQYDKVVKSHKWDFPKNTQSIEFSFDYVFETRYNESGIPGMFDELLSMLDKLIQSGAVDKVSAINDLKELIAMIEQNKQGSYFSIWGVGEFLGRFVLNSSWSYIKDLKVAKHLVKGFEKTVKDMDVDLKQLKLDVSKDIDQQFKDRTEKLPDESILKLEGNGKDSSNE